MTHFFGHKVEVTLNLPDECGKRYKSVPFSIADDFSERIECGTRSGEFENLPDDELSTADEGSLLSGSWRIVEIDYEKIRRVLTWDYNFAPDEALTEELLSVTSAATWGATTTRSGHMSTTTTCGGCWPTSEIISVRASVSAT